MKENKIVAKTMVKIMGEIIDILNECKILSYKLMTLDAKENKGTIHWNSQIPKEWFYQNVVKVSTFEELLKVSKDYKKYLISKMTEEDLQFFEDKSMEEWIKPEFSRYYYNELDNNVEVFCEKFEDLLERFTNGNNFIVTVYDLSDEDFYFGTKEEAELFINEIDSPWTLFENKETYCIEINCG